MWESPKPGPKSPGLVSSTLHPPILFQSYAPCPPLRVSPRLQSSSTTLGRFLIPLFLPP